MVRDDGLAHQAYCISCNRYLGVQSIDLDPATARADEHQEINASHRVIIALSERKANDD